MRAAEEAEREAEHIVADARDVAARTVADAEARGAKLDASEKEARKRLEKLAAALQNAGAGLLGDAEPPTPAPKTTEPTSG